MCKNTEEANLKTGSLFCLVENKSSPFLASRIDTNRSLEPTSTVGPTLDPTIVPTIGPKSILLNITVPTYSSTDCGGYDVWIEINVGNRTCNTSKITEFDAGDTLLWVGKYLGSCQDFIFDKDLDDIHYKVKTEGGNDFCPKYFYAFMDSATFKSEIMTQWYEVSKTNDKNHIARRTHGTFVLPIAGKLLQYL